MRFSIITPSFNQGRFITDCLESVRRNAEELSENLPGAEVEHIVVDACSTDETVGILEEWERGSSLVAPGSSLEPNQQPKAKNQERTTPLRFSFTSEPDDGQTDAINKGFHKATGDWRMWLNADDYLLPGALSKVADFVQNNPEADVIYGDCLFVNEQKQTLREKREGRFSLNQLHFYGCYIPSTACFYRERIFSQDLYLNPAYKVCMDFEYYLRLAHAGCRFEHVPELLAGFRWHGDNISSNFVSKRMEERLHLQREYIEKRGLPKWLGNYSLLRGIFHTYRLRRFIGRLIAR